MASADGEQTYRLKRIRYHDKELPILMQNENGPCPLLAIANVLQLRGELKIHPDRSEVTFSELATLLGERMLEQNMLSDNAEARARGPRQPLSPSPALAFTRRENTRRQPWRPMRRARVG